MTKASNEPLISIIVPIYKVEEYLDKCIESIVDQTYNNLEIILVDDGSPDNCPKMCDKWAKRDNRILVIHKENGGVCSARNSGLKKAKGKWIAFIDSDDWVEKEYIKELYDCASRKKSSIVASGYCRIAEHSKEYINNSGNMVELNAREFLIKILNPQTGMGFCATKLYKKEIIENMFFDSTLVVGEDAVFNTKLVKKIDRAVVYKRALYNYRSNLDSAVRKYDVNYIKKYTNSMENMKKYINDNYSDDRILEADLANYIVYHLMLICVNYCYNPQNNNKRKSLKEACKMKIYANAIKNCNYDNLSLSRKITLFTIKHRMYFFTGIICRVRQLQIRK